MNQLDLSDNRTRAAVALLYAACRWPKDPITRLTIEQVGAKFEHYRDDKAREQTAAMSADEDLCGELPDYLVKQQALRETYLDTEGFWNEICAITDYDSASTAVWLPNPIPPEWEEILHPETGAPELVQVAMIVFEPQPSG
jgi:hypothetical protein